MIIRQEVVVDIEMDLVFMEHILCKYKTLPEDALYIIGKRYPIKDRVNITLYKNKDMLGNQPFYPILALGIVKTLVDIIAGDNNPYRELVNGNPLIENGEGAQIYTTQEVSEIGHIILEYYPMVTVEDYQSLVQYATIISDKITAIIIKNPTRIYRSDDETNQFKLLIGDDITTYRYYEALEHKKININKPHKYESEDIQYSDNGDDMKDPSWMNY